MQIILPVAEGAVKAPPSGELLPHIMPAPSSKTRFLVVDDEDYMRALLRDILEKEGFEVALAEGGREALLLLEDAQFDGIFTDLGMAGMSGWEFARAIREHDKRIPIAVITGWGAAVGSEEQKAAEVDWVVAKPFTIEQVVGIAREVSKRREENLGRVVSIVAA